MKSLILGGAVAVALASLGSDASAADLVASRRALAPAAGAHGGMTLAKAKKKKGGRRPAGAGAPAKADDADDASGGDDSASSAASADSSDAAKEDELLGTKKKKAPAPADDGESSGGETAKPAKSAKSASSSNEEVETVASKASEEQSDASPSSALEFGVGFKALFRQLAWTSDARAAGLGPYSLTPGPETGVWLEFYPAAFGTSGFASNVGLFGRFDYGFGVATTLANSRNVATTFRDFLGGIKVRIPLGMMIPNVSLAYGQQSFEIAPAMSTLDLPKVAYSFIRPAIGTRVMFAPTVALDIAAAYLMVFDPGSGVGYIKGSNFFPNATSLGFDVGASVAFRISGAIGARGGIEFRQYALNMNDRTAPTVGGAVDRYITMFAGIEVVLDGMGGAAGDDEPAKPSKRKRRHAPDPDEESESSSDDSKSEDE